MGPGTIRIWVSLRWDMGLTALGYGSFLSQAYPWVNYGLWGDWGTTARMEKNKISHTKTRSYLYGIVITNMTSINGTALRDICPTRANVLVGDPDEYVTSHVNKTSCSSCLRVINIFPFVPLLN